MGLHFRASGPFWGSWSILGLDFGLGGPFWGSFLVPVIHFWARFWSRRCVLGLHFGAGGPFWGCGAGGPFLGLHCGTGGPFWGCILVPVLRFEAPFWCVVTRYSGSVRFGDPFWGSILVPVVRFGAPFSGASFLDLLGFGFGPPLASGASALDLLWFWTCSGFRGLVFEPPLASRARFWAPKLVLGPSRPTISESPYICFKSSNHPLFASLAFVFPFAPQVEVYLDLGWPCSQEDCWVVLYGKAWKLWEHHVQNHPIIWELYQASLGL